jgi:hypothetical protein
VTSQVVEDETDAVLVLRTSIRRAHEALLSGLRDTAEVNAVLAGLAADLAPAFPHLHVVANAQPNGPVAGVLSHLQDVFTHAAAGRPDEAVSAVIATVATGFRLADDATLNAEDTEDGDPARWR